MKKPLRFLAVTVIATLIVWLVVLQAKLNDSVRERRQLEATFQSIVAQHEAANDDVASLQRRIASLENDLAQANTALRSAKATPGLPAATGAPAPASPNAPKDQAVRDVRTPLPDAVAAILTQRFGPIEISEVKSSQYKGLPGYSIRGTTADGRAIGVTVSEDGTILAGKWELALESLPESVAGSIRDLGPGATIGKAHEIYNLGGIAEYYLSGQPEPGKKLSLNVAADGHIMSGEVERSPTDLPDVVRATVAQTIANREPSSVVETFGGKGRFFEVAFENETERLQLVVDQGGRLVSFASKASYGPAPTRKKFAP